MKDQRTGLRKPTKHLKTWADRELTRRINPRLRVGMVDEELPEIERGKKWTRKSWYITLTQHPDLLATLGPVKGAPTTGKTLLLFEDDVIALVQYLVDGELVAQDENGRIVNCVALEDQFVSKLVAKTRTQSHKLAR
jgi:hypothetical protein